VFPYCVPHCVLTSFGKEGDGAVRVILKQLIDAETVKDTSGSGTDSDFLAFLKDYANSENSSGSGFERSTIIKYVFDCIKDKNVIFIIDDLDMADEYTVDTLDKLASASKNLKIIFSCRSSFDNAALENFIKYRSDEIIRPEPLQLSADVISEELDSLHDTQDTHDKNIKSKQPEKPIEFYLKKAQKQRELMQYEKEAETLTRALELSRKQGKEITQLDILIDLGIALAEAKKADIGIEYFNLAYNLAIQLDLPEKWAAAAHQLAAYYRRKVDNEKAREYIMHTESIFTTTERRRKHYKMYRNHIHEFLQYLIEYNETELFHKKLEQAFEICEKDDADFLSCLYYDKGYFHFQRGELDEAMESYTKAQKMAEKAKNHKVWEQATGDMGTSYYYTGKPDLCMQLYQEVIDKSPYPRFISIIKSQLAAVQYQFTMDVKDAIKNINECLNLDILSGITTNLFTHCTNLVEINVSAEDYLSSYINLQKLIKINNNSPLVERDRIYLTNAQAIFYESVGDFTQMQAAVENSLELCGDLDILKPTKMQMFIFKDTAELFNATLKNEDTGKLKTRIEKLYEFINEFVSMNDGSPYGLYILYSIYYKNVKFITNFTFIFAFITTFHLNWSAIGVQCLLYLLLSIIGFGEVFLYDKKINLILVLVMLITLTACLNRRGFDNRFKREWKIAISNKTPFGYMIIDADKFKVYNDTYGHSQGDVLLQKVATELKSSERDERDYVARWGGEEFIMC